MVERYGPQRGKTDQSLISPKLVPIRGPQVKVLTAYRTPPHYRPFDDPWNSLRWDLVIT